jgi:hypothetical protein
MLQPLQRGSLATDVMSTAKYTSCVVRLTKLPREDRRVVLVAGDERLHVVLERSLDGGGGVEITMDLGARDLLGVDVHASVVFPVVRERHNELDASSFGSCHHKIEVLQTQCTSVDRGGGAIP